MTRFNGMDAWITDRGIVYDFYRFLPEDSGLRSSFDPSADLPGPDLSGNVDSDEFAGRTGHVIRMEFAEATGKAAPAQGTRRKGYYNYLIGNDRSKWATRVPLYGVVTLQELYPGVDAVMRFDAGSLRYDLHVAAGADPGRIRMKLSGAGEIVVNGKGELVLRTTLGDVTHGSIVAYQEIEGEERRVECRFREESEGEVAFSLGTYDPRYPLVIDPLVYATFLSEADYGAGGALVVDDEGNAYVTGRTTLGTYPTTEGAYDRTRGGGGGTVTDIVVTKLNESGTDVIYSTYIGGGYSEAGASIAIDGERNAYVLGWTQAGGGLNDFPVTPGAFDTSAPASSGGPFGNNDMVVCKLNPSGTALLYSTYLGGTSSEGTGGIAVDRFGNAHVTGYTWSRNYPVTDNAFKRSAEDPGFSSWEVFVTKLNGDGSDLLYSTYLGGERYESGYDIALDAEGFAYVTGETTSYEFPTTPGAYDGLFDVRVSEDNYDAFVTKLDTTGSKLIYSTFLGMEESDRGRGVVVDDQGNAYVTGETRSASFPITPGAFDDRLSGVTDGFVVKLNPTGTGLIYSTFIGGDVNETFSRIALHEGGNAVAVGTSTSDNYKTTAGAFDGTFSGDTQTDVVLAALNGSGSALLYSTFLGDVGQDVASEVAVDPSGTVYVGGYTTAARFPVTPGAYDTLPPSSQSTQPKIFVARFRLACALTVRLGADISICRGSSLPLNTEVANGVPHYTYSWSPAQGLDKIDVANPVATPAGTTQYIVTVTDDGGCVARDTVVITVLDPPNAFAGADTTICSGGEAWLGTEATGTRPPFTYAWEPRIGLSDPTAARTIARPDISQTYIVTVTDAVNCQTKDTVVVTVLDPLLIDPGPDVAVCSGEEIVIGREATGGAEPYRYRWEPSTGLSRADVAQPIASPALTTDYRVTVTDALGCSVISDPVKVTVRARPVPTITASGSTTLCDGDSVTLDGGGGYQRYLWSTGQTTQTIRVGASGTYSLEVEDADGCTGTSDAITVQVHPRPNVKISGAAGVCAGATGIYSVPAEPNVTYDWELQSGSATIVSGNGTNRIVVRWLNVEDAIVQLTARDQITGCTAVATHEVNVGSELNPVIQGPAEPLILCAGQSVELDAGEGYSEYLWSTGETTRTIRVDRTATVTVRVREAGCEGTSAPYTVTVKPPLSVNLTKAGDIRLCPGASQILIAPSGYAEYLWSTGERSESIEVSAEGIYWVEVRDADGCTGVSDTARILQSEEPPLITPGGSIAFCDGESVTLSAGSGYVAYEWSTGERTRSIEVTSGGDYWVKVTGVGGCEATSNTAEVTVLPVPDRPTITRVGDTLISSAVSGNRWRRDGADIPAATEQRYVIDRMGTYTVRVTNPEGCSAESDEFVGMRSRVVWLDTTGGEVGKRLWLTMHIDPPLTASEGVTDFSAWLLLQPAALYPQGATSTAVAGDEIGLDYDMANGAILVKPVRGGATVTGGALFRLELEGLVTGQPLNIVAIDSVVLEGLGGIPILADGIVTLTGCEVDRRFSKRARIVSIVPNPGIEEVVVIYRTPEGMEMNLRLLDALGRVMKTRKLEAGSGDDEVVRVELSGLSTGLYMLELRDGEEVVTAPLLIKR